MMDSDDYNLNLKAFFKIMKKDQSIFDNLEKSGEIWDSQDDMDQEDVVDEFRELII